MDSFLISAEFTDRPVTNVVRKHKKSRGNFAEYGTFKNTPCVTLTCFTVLPSTAADMLDHSISSGT